MLIQMEKASQKAETEQKAMEAVLKHMESKNFTVLHKKQWNCKSARRNKQHCCTDACIIDHHCIETNQMKNSHNAYQKLASLGLLNRAVPLK